MKMRFQELGITIFNPAQTYLVCPARSGAGTPGTAGPQGGGSRMNETAPCWRKRVVARRGIAFVHGPAMREALQQHGSLADWDDVRGELERSGPGHLHGRWRALSEAPPRGVCRRRARHPPQAAPAALPEPRLQRAEWRHRALVRAGAAGDRRRPEHDDDPADVPRAVRAADPDAGLAYRDASVPHRGARRRSRASRRPKARTKMGWTMCWCC